MSQKMNLDYIIFWSSILMVTILNHKANAILTDSNNIYCTQVQCPTKCPEDSYLKSTLDDEDDDFEDYKDELLDHVSYIEEIGHFEELPPEEEIHETHSPQHMLKERQKREVFFQDDIERCCEDQKCVCKECDDIPKCAEGHVAVEIQEGHSVPGSCCSKFRCIKKDVCQLGMKNSWWTSKCTKCSCFGETELCMQICPEEEILQNCYSEYLQKPMMNGAFWKEGSCTSCSCEQGNRRCLTPVCPKLDCKETIRFEDECCPKCVDDESDIRTEIERRKEPESEDATTINSLIINVNKGKSSNVSADHGSIPVDVKHQFTTTATATTESVTSPVTSDIITEIVSTLQPELIPLFKGNITSIESTTSTPLSYKPLVSSTLQPKSVTLFEEESSTSLPLLHSTLSSVLEILTSSEQPKSVMQLELNSSIAINTTTTEEPISIREHEHDSSTTSTSSEKDVFSAGSTMDMMKISSTPTTETSEETISEDTTTPDSAMTTTTPENSTPASTTYTEVSSQATMASPIVSSIATPLDVSSTSVVNSSTQGNNAIATADDTNTTRASWLTFSTSGAPEATSSTDSTTSNAISSSIMLVTAITYTTNPPLDSTSELSIPTYTKSSASTEYLKLLANSTTSSPYPPITYSTTTSNLVKSTSTSTTTAPEPLKPLFQSYGDFNSNMRTIGSQKQMRIMFDKIDYIVMIALFTGSLLCISLGLTIRHIKNRKKMYSSIPNSETSLSQTSTNTILTV